MAAPPSGPPTYRYPYKALKEFDDYLQIQVVQYQPPKFQSGDQNVSFTTSTGLLSNNNVTPIAQIILPIPQNIQDSNTVDWGDSSLNALEATGLKVATEGMQQPNFAGAFGGALGDVGKALEGVVAGGNGQDLVTSFFASKVVNALGSNVDTASVLSRSTGQVLNPNMELLFKGVSLREFSFDFDFSPRDGAEAAQIKQIIRTFKKAQAARTTAGAGQGAGLFISAPNVFKLEYKSGGKKHPFLNTFKPMAMKGMQVNYTGSGTYAVYGDSTPIHMKMTLNFQELNPIYFEDYKDDDIGVGY